MAFTDSTIFSNFFIFMRGKAELALGLVEWAHRANSWWWINGLAGSAGLLLALRVLWVERTKGFLTFLSIGAPSAVLAVFVLEGLNARAYAPPKPHAPVVEIAFDGEHSDFFIPEFRLGQEGDKDFDAFFVWVQRVGFVPRKPDHLQESFGSARAIVMIDPVRRYTKSDVSGLAEFVERGGGLLVMDDRDNRGSTAGSVLAAFGIGIKWPEETPSAVGLTGLLQYKLSPGAGAVEGVGALITASDGRVVLGVKNVGRGRVFVLANSRVFGRALLGHVNMNPDPDQLMLSRFEFELMRCLADSSRSFSLDWMDPGKLNDAAATTPKDAGSAPRTNGKKGD